MIKRILFALLITLPLFAQTDPDRRTGVTFSVAQSGGDIAFRRLLPPDWALLASIGFAESNLGYNPGGPAGPLDARTYTLSAGVRRYFASSELRPFGEVTAGYDWTELPGCDDVSNPRAAAAGGVEYAIARRVSIEGSAGLAYSRFSQRCESGGIEFELDRDALSTFRTALSITFYF
jgi:hypothetical protein